MFFMCMAVRVVGWLFSVCTTLSNSVQKSLPPNVHGPLGKYLGTSPKSAVGCWSSGAAQESNWSYSGSSTWATFGWQDCMNHGEAGPLCLLDAMATTSGLSTPDTATYTVLGPPLRSARLHDSTPPHPSGQGGFMQTVCWERSPAWFSMTSAEGWFLLNLYEQTLQKHSVAKWNLSFS